jgi:hypothetical protein
VTPLFATPPTLVDAVSGTRVWLFDGKTTIAIQTEGDMTLGVAQFLAGPVEQEVQRRWGNVKAHFIHDWRSCVRYESAARDAMMDWAKATRSFARMSTVQISADASVFIRIAATTGVSMLRVARVDIELVDDLAPLCKTLQ